MSNKTTKTKKVTKAQRNIDIMSLLQGQPVKYGTTVEDAIKHLTHENELLSKKNTSASGEKKLTKTQLVNEGYKKEILAYLRANPSLLVTASDVMDLMKSAHPDVLWSNQKAASLLNAMSDKYDKDTDELVSEGVLNRVEGKGKNKTTFQIKPEYVTAEEDGDAEE